MYLCVVLSAEENYIIRVEALVTFLEQLVDSCSPHVPEMPEPHSLAAFVVALEACVLAAGFCTGASSTEINSHSDRRLGSRTLADRTGSCASPTSDQLTATLRPHATAGNCALTTRPLRTVGDG